MGRAFHELDIWRNGFNLVRDVYKITGKYPSEEKFGLISDTRRSANSVIANIAEAHGRFYYQDKIRVLYISRGEVDEVRSHLSVAYILKYMTLEEFKDLNSRYRGLSVGISNYITSIANQKDNKENENN